MFHRARHLSLGNLGSPDALAALAESCSLRLGVLLCLPLAMLFCLLLAMLFFSFPCAARGNLLSPLSFSPLHTLCVVSFCSYLRALREMRHCSLEFVSAVCCACRCPASWPTSRTSSLRSCSVALLCHRGHLADQANHLSAVTRCDVCDYCNSCSRRCI